MKLLIILILLSTIITGCSSVAKVDYLMQENEEFCYESCIDYSGFKEINLDNINHSWECVCLDNNANELERFRIVHNTDGSMMNIAE